MYDLPTTLSKFLNLGMSLHDVIARATVRPAAAMRRPDLGTLARRRRRPTSPCSVWRRATTPSTTSICSRAAAPQRLVNTATYVGGAALPRLPERPPAPWVARDFPHGDPASGDAADQRPALRQPL